ncbi:arylamine N-acetyltransferase 1 [Cyathus striatus]|nr:arylamine N-acetyltransferase 1 [Cyathus striatus]
MTTTNTSDGILREGAWIKQAPSYYSPAQVYQWLSVMGLSDITEDTITSGTFPTTLENLSKVIRHHLLTYPFENTSMHYTAEHTMDVTPEGAFKRLVRDRKGSYCFGQNGVLLGMLRGLGYRAYVVSARVNEAGPHDPRNYTALTHMVVLVQPHADSNKTYLVDVGFGANGLARPILLSDSEDNVVIGVTPTEKHRLTRGALPSSSLQSSNGSGTSTDIKWNLEVWHEKKDDTKAPWKILYSFSEEEFFTRDAIDTSFLVSQSIVPDGLFCNHVVCVKHFLLTDQDKKVLGDGGVSVSDSEHLYMSRLVLMGKDVRKHVGGVAEVVRTFHNELDRIKALRELFGIDINDDAVAHIKGRVPAL